MRVGDADVIEIHCSADLHRAGQSLGGEERPPTLIAPADSLHAGVIDPDLSRPRGALAGRSATRDDATTRLGQGQASKKKRIDCKASPCSRHHGRIFAGRSVKIKLIRSQNSAMIRVLFSADP